MLNKMGKAENSNCKYCPVVDYIEHFFRNCSQVIPLWEKVENILSIATEQQVKLNDKQKLFGLYASDIPDLVLNTYNRIILVTKMCISKYKYGEHHNLLWLFCYEMTLRNLAAYL